MATRSTPPARLIQRVHFPARGREARLPLNRPTATSSAVRPMEKTNRYRKPSTALPVVLTKVSTAANAGAPHGAATRPDVAPRANTPPTELPARRPAHGAKRAGAFTVKTS